ncbi:MAG: NAD(P)/FAD-dependent oxidoreductase [Deltaproteobacteria bacterium]|nr:MAG: NAD(P)/FAD-dependent oxidoreductase [Deltaproteobacteria bacterium]
MHFKRNSYDAIIIGSGVGGLCAGARLAHAGYDVLLLEKLSRLGGRKTTKEYKGFQIPTGAIHYHLYGDNGPEAQTLRELGVPWKSRPCIPHTIWRIGNKEYTMPVKGGMKYMFELAGLSAREQERLSKIFIQALRWNEPSDKIPFSEWLLQYSDNKVLYAMYDAWVANISGHGAEKVSAGEFIREMRFFSSPPSVIPGGNRGLIDALNGVMLRHGGEVHVGTKVREIIIEEGKAKGVVVETEKGDTIDLKTKVVISDVGPKATVKLGGRKNFDTGFLKEVDELEPAGNCLIIIYVDDRPLFECSGYLSVPYEYGGCQRISTVCLPSFQERELDAPGKYAHHFFALVKGEKEEEIKLAKEDIRTFYPKDFDEEKILLIQTYSKERPSYLCIPGTGLDQKSPVENLYMVGDGCSPSPYLGGEACAQSAKIVVEDIQKSPK